MAVIQNFKLKQSAGSLKEELSNDTTDKSTLVFGDYPFQLKV